LGIGKAGESQRAASLTVENSLDCSFFRHHALVFRFSGAVAARKNELPSPPPITGNANCGAPITGPHFHGSNQ
jgi:hypothetical protein